MWSNKPQSRRSRELPKDWRKLRARVLARDHGRCVMCGAPATHVDHIERGQDHSSANLRALCQSCHMKRTGHDGGTTKRAEKRRARPRERHPGLVE